VPGSLSVLSLPSKEAAITDFYRVLHDPARWPGIQQERMIMSITLIALATVAATHVVRLDRPGAPVDAQYSARTAVETRTIGTHTPNRIDSRRCQWTATVIVERQLGESTAPARTVSNDRRISGNEAGPCAHASSAIERQLASRADTIRAHLLAAAERDRAPLLAELDAVTTLASN
jgi:hypothetical protein